MKNEYIQLKKNTVAAKNQLKDSETVRFYNASGNGKRIMFVGNSITLHGKCPDIGWYNDCGMAASEPSKDYVHLIMQKIKDAAFCICQVAEWERNYLHGESTCRLFENARDFEADIIVMRFVENCPCDGFSSALFKEKMSGLLHFLDKSQKAKFIITDGFWKHPANETIKEYAVQNELPFVKLCDLGELDEMKAIGLFEHSGVANHPSDLGMKNIADRIFRELERLL